jgi:hypothetical protein
MSSILNQNQFAPTPILGMTTRDPQPATISARINPSSVATGLQVGTPLKLIASVSTEIVVDLAAATDVLYGVIPFNTKKNTYVKGDVVEVCTAGNIMLLETAAAVNRGDTVKIENTSAVGGGPGVTTDNTSTHHVGGVALGQAAASQALIAIKIQPAVLP